MQILITLCLVALVACGGADDGPGVAVDDGRMDTQDELVLTTADFCFMNAEAVCNGFFPRCSADVSIEACVFDTTRGCCDPRMEGAPCDDGDTFIAAASDWEECLSGYEQISCSALEDVANGGNPAQLAPTACTRLIAAN